MYMKKSSSYATFAILYFYNQRNVDEKISLQTRS